MNQCPYVGRSAVPEKNKLRILMVASEFAPYAKTGGLADAAAGLASALKKKGHDIRVVMPNYRGTLEKAPAYETVFESMCVTMGRGENWCGVISTASKTDVPVYLVQHDHFFSRTGLYHTPDMQEYADNPLRFAFLARAALQICLDTDFAPDIVHANDWQTALVPAYLKKWFWNDARLGSAASVLTIHNIAYQGVYPGAAYDELGLGADSFAPDIFEAFGEVNFLKGGIYYADMVNTVSEGHAREIVAPHGGFGLAPYLANKGVQFTGITNGVDYDHWSPEEDEIIPEQYSVDNRSGKTVCKRELQKAFGLEQSPDTCLIATIGRFVGQKGFGLIRDSIDEILSGMSVQFAILGSGEHWLQSFFWDLPGQWPGRVGSFIGYNNDLAHLIEAGADFFLMPSVFEPCGLNQMYSLRYGTPPIVRATGGLDDTVEQYNENTGEGTGFKFRDPTASAVRNTVGWAVSTYYDRREHLEQIITAAMKKDFSWDVASSAYEDLYRRAINVKRDYDSRHV